MEVLIFIGAFLLIFLLIVIQGNREVKQREKWCKDKFRTLYGNKSSYQLDLEAVNHIKRFFEKHKAEHQIDDITWNDLDMDLLYERMNYCDSSCGDEFLYYRLRTPVFKEEELKAYDQKIEYFASHEKERVESKFSFMKMGRLGKYSIYDYLDHLEQLEPVNNASLLIWDILLVPAILLMMVSFPIGLFALIGIIIHNILTYFKMKKVIEPYITSFAFIFSMLNVLTELQTDLEPKLFEDEIRTMNRCFGQMKRFQTGSFLVMQSRSLVMSSNPLEILVDYACMTLFLDLLKFNQMLAIVREHHDTIEACLYVLGEIESEISICHYRAGLGNAYCKPSFDAEDICAEMVYHPLLDNPKKNSIENAGNVLLTGSNASGKSTFLKTIALNSLLAETIYTCAADSFRTSFFEIVSSMSLRDSIAQGDSYYIAEIKSIKRIFDRITKQKEQSVRLLCFLDEVLRGTNTVERIAGATEILKELAQSDVTCYAATHDIELTDLLEREYTNYHFEERIHDGDIYFSYELMEGKATSRNAIRLLECMGFSENLIAEADGRAKHFLETGEWLTNLVSN